MRVLSLTTLYPYPKRPRHGVFVENRLRAVAATGVEIEVIAPVPYFPLGAQVFGDWAKFANPPAVEVRHGITIHHPRYPIVPKVGMSLAVEALTAVFEHHIAAYIARSGRPDVLDAHYLYPDGVAAIRAARAFALPVVMTARGTDVTLIPTFPKQRAQIVAACDEARAVVTVADALREELIGMGVAPSRVRTIRNGVDLELFSLRDASASRGDTSSQRSLVSVGHLIERKGQHRLIEAMASLPNTHLTLIGGGEAEKSLKDQAERLGVADRVTFAGEQPHERLAAFYGEADASVLASSREGWPNVLLESMACGTPAVTTPAHGSVEVVTSPEAGRVTQGFTAASIVSAVKDLFANPPKREATRRYAEGYGWAPVAEDVKALWQQAMEANSPEGWGAPSEFDFLKERQRLLLTVDTEECFNWNGRFDTWTIPPVSALDAIQGVAEKHGVKPLYFVTYPLLEDDEMGGRLAQLVAEGRAHCGIHLHSWSTPPAHDLSIPRETFQCNIAPSVHAAKLRALCDMFQKRMGVRPIAHRAGRYGVAPHILDQLADEGVDLDFSPSPGFNFAQYEGPDFSGLSPMPHRRQRGRNAVMFPVSGARAWRRVGGFVSSDRFAPGKKSRAALTPLTAPMRLTPEGNSVADMKALSRHLTNLGGMLLTPSLHLSSLVSGETPYTDDGDAVESLLGRLSDYLGWALKDGVQATDLEELRERTRAR